MGSWKAHFAVRGALGGTYTIQLGRRFGRACHDLIVVRRLLRSSQQAIFLYLTNYYYHHRRTPDPITLQYR